LFARPFRSWDRKAMSKSVEGEGGSQGQRPASSSEGGPGRRRAPRRCPRGAQAPQPEPGLALTATPFSRSLEASVGLRHRRSLGRRTRSTSTQASARWPTASPSCRSIGTRSGRSRSPPRLVLTTRKMPTEELAARAPASRRRPRFSTGYRRSVLRQNASQAYPK
jgi:hypothetical protein